MIDLNIALASRVQFRRLIAADQWRKAVEILSTIPNDFPFIDRVFLADTTGTEMAAMPTLAGAVGNNFSYRDWYQGVAADWEPYISHVYTRAAQPQINVFAVAVPIKDDNSNVLGVLVTQINLEGFFSWAEGLDIGPGGFIYVVDKLGQLAYHPEFPTREELVDFSEAPVVKMVLRGETGVAINFNPIEKIERLSAYVPVEHGWAIIVQQPALSAFATKNRQLNRIRISYALILLCSLLVLGLALMILRQRQQAENEERVRNKLETRVAERTEELQIVNRELESFSYSVSHDLRAPLRAVEGFTLILEEDYGDILDEEGKRLLNVVRDNAKRMSLLIDDLLEFSRLGRQSINLSNIDMQELVAEAFDEIASPKQRQRVRLTAKPLPPARGDRTLLKQVWINLLSNALKYSSLNDQPIIEYGGYVSDSDLVYYVKDNGVGFDMQYYDKLFTVFQRLHSETQFSGTGIGLAIVQRVVNRHGGRVWADAKAGEGSTFYFSLKKDEIDERS